MKVTTEGLLTSPDAFGIATATPAQRAACRVLDGLPLGDMAEHPDVVALLGGAEAVRALPAGAPLELVFLAAIRSAKTIIACAAGLRMALTVDVSRLGPGEVPRVSLVSLRLDTSAVAFRMLLDTVRGSRALSPLVLSETAETLTLQHPSGRPIEVATVAGAKAGGGLVARWSAGVVFDEAPRMNGASDGVVNLDDARSAVLGRLLPGAQALYIGSPWAPQGPVYTMVQEHWGKPSSGVVVMRGTGPMLNPTWWTPERCAELQVRNPAAYLTDVMGEFADPESGLLNPFALRRNTRPLPPGPLELPPDYSARYSAAVDPSEGGAGGNGFSLAIVQWIPAPKVKRGQWGPHYVDWRKPEQPLDTGDRYRVVLVREWRGLGPDACWGEIAKVCERYGIRSVVSDQYAASANVDIARRHGIRVRVEKATATTNLEEFTNLQTIVHGDRLELSPDPVLLRDLQLVKKRVTQQGYTIVRPRTSDGRHCNLASALCAAVAHRPHETSSYSFHIPGL